MRCVLDYTYSLVKTRLSDTCDTVEGAGNLQRFFRCIEVVVEREILRQLREGTFCSKWVSETPEELRHVPVFSPSSALREIQGFKVMQESRTAQKLAHHAG